MLTLKEAVILLRTTASCFAPGMGNNPTVKVHCAPGSYTGISREGDNRSVKYADDL